MRIHHLNCGSLCPRGGKLFGGAGGPLSAAPMCCHCLLIEGDDRLILVDAGLGVEDVNEPSRLGFLFNTMVRPRLEVAETALRQVVDLGYRPSDVRHIVPTHLDLDHAGGICDFPDAAVHVFAAELRAASHRSSLSERNRYRAVQIAAIKKWAPVEEDGQILVRLFSRARDSRNARRGAAGAAARPYARALRRRGPAGERLAAPLRRRLFPPRRSRPERPRCAEGLALVPVAGRRRRRSAARQSSALARTRAPWARRSEAHLLARHNGFRRDEERGVGGSASSGACSSASAGRRVARGGATGPARRRPGVAAIGACELRPRERPRQSAPLVLPLSALTAPRRVLSSTRRTLEASVGRVARRRFGRV